MTDSLQPTSGNLSARIIRKCPAHTGCPLACPQRQVEDLGEIATFLKADDESLPPPSLLQRIKEVFSR